MSKFLNDTKSTHPKHIGQERPELNPITMFPYVVRSNYRSKHEMSRAIIMPPHPLFQMFSVSGPNKKVRQEKARTTRLSCQQSFYSCPDEAQCPACRRTRKSSGQFVFYISSACGII